jgi:signal transduction histidine kinase
MGILSGNIASVHLLLHDYDSSLFYYFKNLRLIKRTREVENEIETYAHLGKVFIRKKNDVKAMVYLDSALAIIKTKKILFNDFFNPMDEINESYAHVYALRGDYKKAFDYHTKFHQVAQEKQQQLNGRSLKQLQSTFAFKQKQNELDLLQQINEANMSIIYQQKITQITFGAVIILLSALAFIALKTGRQRKKLNRELSHSNEELGRLNTIKDKLFSVISHDLRGPLANLKNMLGLLSDGHLKPDEIHQLSGKLAHQLETSGNTLENLLQWAKTQLSDIKSNPSRIEVSDLVAKVIAQLRQELETKKIICKNLLGKELVAWADVHQVEIIFRNLIGNAIKFTESGGLISISGSTDGKFVNISVEDSGVGMTDEQVANLFQPGKHFSSPGTNQEKGTGIGLIITNEMIMNNGGTVSVASKPYQGTKFTFTLPVMSTRS